MAQAYYQTAPVQCPLQRTELYMHLFLRQAAAGPNRNQSEILNPKVQPSGFGVTAASDWTIADRLEPSAKIVARAKGFHMQTGITNTSWYTSFNMVFEDERFSGSTLQVMGLTPSDGQWAISGGTGEFALAHGIIKQKVVQGNADENVKELHVHAFYTKMNTSVVPGATDGKSWTLGA
ncbi:LOW QUALITY PROTEIN: hypothetical protein CFC21_001983 [Triticum aestivum]|uniref:Dirigent protein n=1 Tax=Triticum aestivum TaxID=4565 RepID=A0A3B5XZS5_WHEAT|nr:LOW QUALITY PROTEIN: hypothetical protein CFC21_001983 [Triticum aestivum]